MDAKELRIGNYLSRLDNSIFKVIHYDFKRILTLNESLHPKPIPITEEILSKIDGFNKIYFDDEIEDNEYCLLLEDIEYNIRLEYYDGKLFLIDDCAERIGSQIKYLHQLQNLFYCLKGEELTLKNN